MLVAHAAWVLLAAFALSLGYETWRMLTRGHVSSHDSRAAWLRGLPVYAVAGAAVWALFAALPGAAWIGLAVALAGILVSTFHYNPVVMRDRAPGPVDWAEDILFTGLLFVATWLLAGHLLGFNLTRAG